jgi:hypothetical protein
MKALRVEQGIETQGNALKSNEQATKTHNDALRPNKEHKHMVMH